MANYANKTLLIGRDIIKDNCYLDGTPFNITKFDNPEP
jgi:hypothetical protein